MGLLSGYTLVLLLVGVVGSGLFLLALWQFFETESEWHRGRLLWIAIAFIGFLMLAFVLVARLTGGRAVGSAGEEEGRWPPAVSMAEGGGAGPIGPL
ncbi:MAG: hypothetical protein GTO03_15020 [Planctomycetales bacterium]|nr:hypothetical protein [Planctomycetales bacterium]